MTAPQAAPRPAAFWGALATIYVVWGSTYLGIMVAIETLPPLLMSAARFLVAGALLYACAIGRGDRRGDRPTRHQWWAAGVIGAALLLLGNGGVAVSELRIDSGVAALLVATIPLWMAFLDRVVYGRALSAVGVAGIVVGLGGVALLAGPAGDGIDLVGALVCLGAAFAWAAGSLYTREADLPARPLVGAGMQMLVGGGLLVIAGIAAGELGQVDLGAVSLRSSLALVYLVVFGSLLGFTCYIWLLKTASTSLVSTYAYVNPVVAVALGAVFLSEPITVRTIVAGLAIVVAVALIVTARSRPAERGKRLPDTAELRRRSRRRRQDARASTARPSAPLTGRADSAQRL